MDLLHDYQAVESNGTLNPTYKNEKHLKNKKEKKEAQDRVAEINSIVSCK